MKRIIVCWLAVSSVFFSVSALGQEANDGTQSPPSKLQPPKYVPGQGQEGPPLTYRQRRALEREEIRKQRRIEKLYQIMEIEGREFSEEKYSSYNARFGGGLALTIIGGISFISGFFYGMATLFEEMLDDWGDDDEQDDPSLFEERRIALHSLFWGGLLSVAIGVPTLVKGIKGRNRQNYLRQKDRILAPARDVRLGFSFDPSTKAGGFSLGVTF